MRVEILLLAAVLLIGILCLVTAALTWQEVREVRKRQGRDQPSSRLEIGQELQNDIRNLRSELLRGRTSLNATAWGGDEARRGAEPARTSGLSRPDGPGVPLPAEGPGNRVYNAAVSLDDVARRLIRECDAKPIESLRDVPDWVGAQGYWLEPVAGDADDWFLAVLASEDDGVVVPNMRRPMGRVDLNPYFELVNYNGVDPLRGEKIGEFARVARTGGGWAVTRKGLIQG